MSYSLWRYSSDFNQSRRWRVSRQQCPTFVVRGKAKVRSQSSVDQLVGVANRGHDVIQLWGPLN